MKLGMSTKDLGHDFVEVKIDCFDKEKVAEGSEFGATDEMIEHLRRVVKKRHVSEAIPQLLGEGFGQRDIVHLG